MFWRASMRNVNGPRLLLDTNILLDAVSLGRPQSAEAREVLRRCSGFGELALVTPTSLNDAFYVLRKQYGLERARILLNKMMELVCIVPISAEECLMSVASDEPDFEDGMIRACAELNDVDFILTRDAAAYRRSTVRSMTCAEYLEVFPLNPLA